MIKTTPSPKLTDTQRRLLSGAAQRPDAAVALPARRGRAAASAAQALLAHALVREIRAKADLPVWRQDDDTGRGFSLVLTKAGRGLTAENTAVPSEEQQPATSAAAAPEHPEPGSAAKPRAGGKLAEVIALLRREGGSSVAELMAVTGWLPHSTRAALTGLRKRGYAVTREAGESGSVYRIASPDAPAAAA